jgi:hypothetical protein
MDAKAVGIPDNGGRAGLVVDRPRRQGRRRRRCLCYWSGFLPFQMPVRAGLVRAGRLGLRCCGCGLRKGRRLRCNWRAAKNGADQECAGEHYAGKSGSDARLRHSECTHGDQSLRLCGSGPDVFAPPHCIRLSVARERS